MLKKITSKISAQYKKLGKDFLLMFVGNFSSKILIFLLVPFYTSCMTTEQYGIVDIITTSVSLLCPFLSLTIAEAVMRFALEKNSDVKQVFSVGFYITIISVLIMLLISPIALFSSVLKPYYIYMVLYYIVSVFLLFVNQFAKGIDNVKEFSIAGILQTVVTILCNLVFLLLLQKGIEGYLLSYIIGYGIGILYLAYTLNFRQYLLRISKVKIEYFKKMISFSVPLIANNLAWWILNSSDKYMIQFFSGASDVGIYSVAYKIPTIMTTITSLFSASMRISAIPNYEEEESKQFVNKTFYGYVCLLGCITSGMILCVKIFAWILFQKDFFIAWRVSAVLLLGYMFYAIAEYIGVVFLATNKTTYILHSCATGAIINIILNIILINYIGYMGAAIATVLSYLVLLVIRIIKARNIMNFVASIWMLLISLVLISIEIWSILGNLIGVAALIVAVICAINFRALIER